MTRTQIVAKAVALSALSVSLVQALTPAPTPAPPTQVDRYHQECWGGDVAGGCTNDGASTCSWCGAHNGNAMYCCNRIKSDNGQYVVGHNCHDAVFPSLTGVSFCVTQDSYHTTTGSCRQPDGGHTTVTALGGDLGQIHASLTECRGVCDGAVECNAFDRNADTCHFFTGGGYVGNGASATCYVKQAPTPAPSPAPATAPTPAPYTQAESSPGSDAAGGTDGGVIAMAVGIPVAVAVLICLCICFYFLKSRNPTGSNKAGIHSGSDAPLEDGDASATIPEGCWVVNLSEMMVAFYNTVPGEKDSKGWKQTSHRAITSSAGWDPSGCVGGSVQQGEIRWNSGTLKEYTVMTDEIKQLLVVEGLQETLAMKGYGKWPLSVGAEVRRKRLTAEAIAIAAEQA